MRPSTIEGKGLTSQLQIRLIEEVGHPDDNRSDDRVLVAGIQDFDV
jgi:hypothetical protein